MEKKQNKKRNNTGGLIMLGVLALVVVGAVTVATSLSNGICELIKASDDEFDDTKLI